MNIFKNKEFVQELQGEADLFEQLIIKLTLYSYKYQKRSSSQIRIAWKLVPLDSGHCYDTVGQSVVRTST
jgi:hypothetical protein